MHLSVVAVFQHQINRNFSTWGELKHQNLKHYKQGSERNRELWNQFRNRRSYCIIGVPSFSDTGAATSIRHSKILSGTGLNINKPLQTRTRGNTERILYTKTIFLTVNVNPFVSDFMDKIIASSLSAFESLGSHFVCSKASTFKNWNWRTSLPCKFKLHYRFFTTEYCIL